jgi:hypothetical protein
VGKKVKGGRGGGRGEKAQKKFQPPARPGRISPPSPMYDIDVLISISSCDEFHCLDACEVRKVLYTQMDDIRTQDLGPGNVEAGCALAKYYQQETVCNATLRNEMAIVILNSEIHSHMKEDRRNHDWDEGQGPCFAHFDTRMAIGTHSAKWPDIEEWSSSAAKGFWASFGIFWHFLAF